MNGKIVFALISVLIVSAGLSFFFLKRGQPSSEFRNFELESGVFGAAQAEKKKIYIGKNEFTVYIADTLEKQSRGLMFVKELAQNEGMMFLFQRSFRPIFYNKNTLIPLDLLWINKGVVKEISFLPAVRTINLTFLSPRENVDAVIELGAGSVQKYEIKAGDRVTS